MFGRLAKAAYLFALALMIVAYAAAVVESPAPQPQAPQADDYWYC